MRLAESVDKKIITEYKFKRKVHIGGFHLHIYHIVAEDGSNFCFLHCLLMYD